MKNRVVITCEHGGNRVPLGFRGRIAGHERELADHRGWDPGARVLASDLAAATRASLHVCAVTRLLVDVDCSVDSPDLFHDPLALTPGARRLLFDRVWQPYRAGVRRAIREALDHGDRVVVVSVHTFRAGETGQVPSDADVGFQLDPRSTLESELFERWRAAIEARMDGIVVRANQPHSYARDGLHRWARQRYATEPVASLRLNVNQEIVLADEQARWLDLRAALAASLADAIHGLGGAAEPVVHGADGALRSVPGPGLTT